MTTMMEKYFILFLLAAANIKSSISAPAPEDPNDPFDNMEIEPTTQPSIPEPPIEYPTEGVEPILFGPPISVDTAAAEGMPSVMGIAELAPNDVEFIPPPTTKRSATAKDGKASKMTSVSKSVTVTKQDGEVVSKSHSNSKGAAADGTHRSVATSASTTGGDPKSKSVAESKSMSIVKKNGDTIIKTVSKSLSKGNNTSGSSTATGTNTNDSGTTTQSNSASTTGDGKAKKSVVKTITKISSTGEVTQTVQDKSDGKKSKTNTKNPKYTTTPCP